MTMGFFIGAFLLVTGVIGLSRRIKFSREPDPNKPLSAFVSSVVMGCIDTAVTAFAMSYGLVLVVRHWP